MQFSIRRPKLPSSETHPEENTYKRLDVTAWLNHLNESGQVEEEYKLRKVRGLAAAALVCLLFSSRKRPQVEAEAVCFLLWQALVVFLYCETIIYTAWLEVSLGLQSGQLQAK